MGDEPPRHSWQAFKVATNQRYGSDHTRIKRELIAEDPICREKGCNRRGDHADHIRPKCLGGATTRENMQLLCIEHSRRKTALEANFIRWHVRRIPHTKRDHLDRGNGPGGRDR
jgi:hypothetical protein